MLLVELSDDELRDAAQAALARLPPGTAGRREAAESEN